MAQVVTSIVKDAQLEATRVPPQSVEAEQSVLGGLLLDNTAWDKIADLLTGQDFYRADHRLIFQHIGELIEHGKPADALTVAESLERSAKLADVGGQAYLGSLALNTPSAANIRRYAEIVRERAIMRNLAAVGTEIADAAYSPLGRDAKALVDEAEAMVFRIAEAGAKARQGFVRIDPLLTETVERIDMLYSREDKSEVIGLATGFVDLDRITSGLQGGDLIMVAGRPSMGKTSLVLNIAEHVALDMKKPVAVFSMEMSGPQLAMRMIGSVGRVDQHELRSGTFKEDDWSRLVDAVGKLNEAQIYIDDSAGLNALEVRSRARRLHRECGGLSLIVVDYLQLMSASGREENRATEIAEISRSLKGLAKELKLPVVALSQLSRSVEARQDKRPMMSDLRECVTGDALVMLADGRRVPIRDLVGTTPEVLAMSAEGRIEKAFSDCVWSKGVKPVIKVNLASGRTIRATAEHRLFGPNGWITVGELTPGARLALSRRLPDPQTGRRWKDDELILLGHLVGDGSYLTHQPMRYTTASEANSEAVTRAAESFGSSVKRYAGRGQWHQLLISGNGNRWHAEGVGKWLKDLGIYGQRSHEKRLPSEVFQLCDEQIGLLLRHLWATDGSITVRKAGQKGSHSAYFATSSHGLALDVAALLMRLGIVARIRKSVKGAYRPMYSVDVSGAEHQCAFLQKVGAFGPRVAPAAALRAALEASRPNTNVDTLPVEAFADIRASMRARGVTTRAMTALRGTAYGGASHFSFAPSRAMVDDYADKLGDESLRRWSRSDLFWDRVVSVEPDGEEEVFDLTVPGPSCWLADGIVSHNSGALEQDADLIIFIYRDEVYNPDTPNKGVAEIIIAKQRNGPTGKINLTFLGKYTRFESYAASARF